ncbi:MAG: CoA pyrophosphatase [Betaproteobacteria bacterium]|jgi:8-oxo-dGTP pyrophosphatase MutT (NUDIX family)|nr:CoA pyrophosphatase [Betaproteobacteria bacterium]
MNARGHLAYHDADWLRERFSAALPYEPVTTGDGHLVRRDGKIRPASVLVPVVKRASGLTVLLTRRTAHLHDHAGQISLPGGRAEEDESPEDTALRETAEEIGLDPRHVEVLGSLTDYVTVTGYRVTPVVGLVSPPFELQPDAFEVAEIFEVPLAVFLDPANHQRNRVVVQGVERQYYAMPYGPYYIWGATAGMLMNLYRFLTR